MFTLQEKPFTIDIPGISFGQKVWEARPSGDGRIDVVRDFRWKNAGSTDEVPSVTLKEFELEFGAWVQMLARLANTAASWTTGGLDPYTFLYNAKPTKFEYNLPLLIKNGDNIRTISNSWGKSKFDLNTILGAAGKKASNEVGDIAGKVLSVGIGLVGEPGFEQVNEFAGTTPESITITFPLYNTVSIKEAYANYQLVSLLTFQNLKTRTTFLTYVPPKIYQVKTQNCLGGLDWPAAYVETLEIESIGTTRELSEYKNGTTILTPEAYKVTIKLKQLVESSSNIFAGAIGKSSVNVIGDIQTDLINASKATAKAAFSAVRNTVQSMANDGKTAGKPSAVATPPQ
jgi:hypothetical protein